MNMYDTQTAIGSREFEIRPTAGHSGDPMILDYFAIAKLCRAAQRPDRAEWVRDMPVGAEAAISAGLYCIRKA